MSDTQVIGAIVGGACAWGTWYLVRIFKMLRKFETRRYAWTFVRGGRAGRSRD